jgi:hypothetical protein
MQGNRASGWLLRGMETDRGCAERDITLHAWNVNYRDYVELFHTLAAEKFVITCHSSPASCLLPPYRSLCLRLLIWLALAWGRNRGLTTLTFVHKLSSQLLIRVSGRQNRQTWNCLLYVNNEA